MRELSNLDLALGIELMRFISSLNDFATQNNLKYRYTSRIDDDVYTFQFIKYCPGGVKRGVDINIPRTDFDDINKISLIEKRIVFYVTSELLEKEKGESMNWSQHKYMIDLENDDFWLLIRDAAMLEGMNVAYSNDCERKIHRFEFSDSRYIENQHYTYELPNESTYGIPYITAASFSGVYFEHVKPIIDKAKEAIFGESRG